MKDFSASVTGKFKRSDYFRVGVMTYDHEPTKRTLLTTDLGAVVDSFKGISKKSGRTATMHALKNARDYLFSNNQTQN